MTHSRALVSVVGAALLAVPGVAAQRPVTLDTVTATASRSKIPGFDERRARGGGRFLSREDLAKDEGKKMSDVLRRVPGLRVFKNPTNSEYYAINSRGAITMKGANPTCYVQLYIDDAPVANEEKSPFNLASLSAQELEAVEYYPGGGSIPTKYNRTGSACGVLLIWTRR